MSDPGVQVIAHPLVQHKLTLMRQKNRSTASFRRLLSEVAMLMAYEVTRDMPTELVEIECRTVEAVWEALGGPDEGPHNVG